MEITFIEAVNHCLPCPFCGEKPTLDKSYVPCEVSIECRNNECHSRPSVFESVETIENKGETITYSPLFEKHWSSILQKWNKRF